jgi:hypothetical protein
MPIRTQALLDAEQVQHTMRYLSAATKVIPEANPGHLLWLARDRAGNSYVSA